jgi:hypothetical protein
MNQFLYTRYLAFKNKYKKKDKDQGT